MKIKIATLMFCIALVFSACTPNEKVTPTNSELDESNINDKIIEKGEEMGYHKITGEEAKQLMDDQKVIIVDVRRKNEYDEGHIENAVLLTDTDIKEQAEEVLPDKDAQILVYCRSGKRSEQASYDLVDLGYTSIYDFGGILSWEYDIVK